MLKYTKKKTKKWHNKRILKREFKVGELVLLFNSRLKLFPGKLHSRWSGPFEITKVFQNGAFEIKNKLNEIFTVNGQRLKHYFCPNDSDYYSKIKLHETNPIT